MGTSALINIYQGSVIETNRLASIIVHYDGDFETLGVDLAQFLSECELVNGIPGGSPKGRKVRYSNGMDDLAAQVITHLKGDEDSAGNVYLVPPKWDKADYEYCYIISSSKNKIKFHAYDEFWSDIYEDSAFSGDPADFKKFAKDDYPKMVAQLNREINVEFQKSCEGMTGMTGMTSARSKKNPTSRRKK